MTASASILQAPANSNGSRPAATLRTGAVQQDQSALTVLAEVKSNELEKLRSLFPGLSAAGLENDSVFPFSKLSDVHFARLIILDPTADLEGKPIPPRLVLIADFDGPLDLFLKELARVASVSLDRLFGCCEKYPSGTALNDSARIAFLLKCKIKENTVYVNWIGRTVAQVLQESLLHDEIQEFLDASSEQVPGRSAPQIRQTIKKFVADESRLSWALEPLPPRSLQWILKQGLEIIALVAVTILLLPLIILILPFFLIGLRIHERSDVASDSVPSTARLEQLASLEDHVVHNQFSAVGLVKRGWFRRTTLSVILFVTNLGTRFLFNRGNLAGVKTIHFARWVFLDDRRRLLFASNYDGSLESYMDDFIDKVAWGLNAVFSNGDGYPTTNWLVSGGAYDEQAFKNFLHTHQVPTQLWYSAYPRLTTLNIINNSKIRVGLHGDLDENAAAAWLELF